MATSSASRLAGQVKLGDSILGQDEMTDSQTALNNLAKPHLHSLTQILIQGVTSRDNALLESALSIQELSLINESLRRLPPVHVPGLLECLLVRLQRRPHRTILLVPWVRSLLLLHSPALASPEAREIVQRTERFIEARLRSQDQVRMAQGQLEVLLARFDEQKRSKAQSIVDDEQLHVLMTQPLATYDESEGDEEYADDDAAMAMDYLEEESNPESSDLESDSADDN